MATTTNGVYNHDVAGLYNRINRFVEEIYKSVSGSGSLMNTFDKERLRAYLKAVRAFVAWVNAQPQLDLPETHPRMIELKAAPVVSDIENESLGDIIRLLTLARDELIASQSARLPSSLLIFDSNRVMAVIDKVEAFLDNFVEVAEPLDLPESSPAVVLSGPGKGGV